MEDWYCCSRLIPTRVWAQEEGRSGGRADWRQVGMVLVNEEGRENTLEINGHEEGTVFGEGQLAASMAMAKGFLESASGE